MKEFAIPFHFNSEFIAQIKRIRTEADPLKKNLSPSLLQFENVSFALSRHFGFCYGVQNAIEKAYTLLEHKADKNIYLINEIIHNPAVNEDLKQKGVRFIFDSNQKQCISWDAIHSDDVMIIPAFGTTLEIMQILQQKGIDCETYDTTCPFVERVWKRSSELTATDHSLIIHGSYKHEETQATFSRVIKNGKALVISGMDEAKRLADFIRNKAVQENEWEKEFGFKASQGFDFKRDLTKIAVVNQTTMLASETQEISDYLKSVLKEKYGEQVDANFGSNRDTLCYATNENQAATLALKDEACDVIIVVGGYNSSNTTHLVEILSAQCPTYFIENENDIQSEDHIQFWNIAENKLEENKGFLPHKRPLKIGLTSGASCPDSVMERVLLKLLFITKENADIQGAIQKLEKEHHGL